MSCTNCFCGTSKTTVGYWRLVIFKTPDITPAQIIALAGSILAVVVAAGLPLSQDLTDKIIQLVTVLAPILIVGDGIVRHGRATGNANKGVREPTTKA